MSDLRITIDFSGVVTSVALDCNVRAFSVLSHGGAGGTRASTVAEAIDLDDTSVVAPLELACFDRATRVDSRSRQFCSWRSNWFGKSQRWECCNESENGNERQLHG